MPPVNTAQELFNVNGLVAVITGGGSGLGLYAARALDANGAKAVYIIGRTEERLKNAAATAVNGTIIPVVGDTSSRESLVAIADRVRREHGYVNLLFANAGVGGPRVPANAKELSIRELQAALLEPDPDDFTKTFHINSTGVFYAAVAFLDLLDEGNKRRNLVQDSQILFTSSIAAYGRHLAVSFAYSISKAAASHLCMLLGTFLATTGNQRIRVNMIAPGLYPTELTRRVLPGEPIKPGDAFDGAFPMNLESCPAERTGSEEDWAGVVLFVVSRAGAYLNGATLLTDGGRLSVLPSSNVGRA